MICCSWDKLLYIKGGKATQCESDRLTARRLTRLVKFRAPTNSDSLFPNWLLEIEPAAMKLISSAFAAEWSGLPPFSSRGQQQILFSSGRSWSWSYTKGRAAACNRPPRLKSGDDRIGIRGAVVHLTTSGGPTGHLTLRRTA